MIKTYAYINIGLPKALYSSLIYDFDATHTPRNKAAILFKTNYGKKIRAAFNIRMSSTDYMLAILGVGRDGYLL